MAEAASVVVHSADYLVSLASLASNFLNGCRVCRSQPTIVSKSIDGLTSSVST